MEGDSGAQGEKFFGGACRGGGVGRKKIRRKGGEICVVTGKKTRYRDPLSGLPYYDAASYQESG